MIQKFPRFTEAGAVHKPVSWPRFLAHILSCDALNDAVLLWSNDSNDSNDSNVHVLGSSMSWKVHFQTQPLLRNQTNHRKYTSISHEKNMAGRHLSHALLHKWGHTFAITSIPSCRKVTSQFGIKEPPKCIRVLVILVIEIVPTSMFFISQVDLKVILHHSRVFA